MDGGRVFTARGMFVRSAAPPDDDERTEAVDTSLLRWPALREGCAGGPTAIRAPS